MDIRDFSLDYFSLKGRVAVVTGGNSGLGQAFSVALAKAGADVFIATVVDDGGETTELIESEGSRVQVMTVDLTQREAPRAVVDGCVDSFGKLDILVNSAGMLNLGSVDRFGRAAWDPMIALNLTAPFELGYEASRLMISQRSGKIINVGSLFSFLGGQGSPAYAATKHGLLGFTRAYCDELAQYNVQVNVVAPGYFETALASRTHDDPDSYKRITDHIPAGRWGEPVDLMGAIVFLASKASDYVNGQVITVDGGYLVR
jgi:NAD(P)-dependent dehydrogenase (short-subunit alcohol dehydrogenase family)